MNRVPSALLRSTHDLGSPATKSGSLIDNFDRVHRSLRISVTDVCNIRCQYCMPAEVQFQPRDRQLSFEQIAQFVRTTARLGVVHYRLTGGEPLLRPRLHELIKLLKEIKGVEEVGLTTNGLLLAEQLPELLSAGLQRVNISLDTLSDATFKKLARRDGLQRVLAGIDAAVQAAPALHLKLNSLVLRDVNLDDVLSLVEFARERNVTLRFIEFMPLDADRSWSVNRMVSGDELRQRIATHCGGLVPVEPENPAQPATDYMFAEGGPGRIGFIDSVTRPFCGTCDRLRLTFDGKVRNCLFGSQEWDVRELLNDQHSEQELGQLLLNAVAAKHRSHGIADADFQPPARAMYQIGG
ncbi:MAG: GTP 3',8-cyclase MoaA [Pirellulaceae bacterium]